MSSLSKEQQAQIEQNKLAALAKRSAKIIERNRQAALAKRNAKTVSSNSISSAPSTSKGPAHSNIPLSVPALPTTSKPTVFKSSFSKKLTPKKASTTQRPTISKQLTPSKPLKSSKFYGREKPPITPPECKRQCQINVDAFKPKLFGSGGNSSAQSTSFIRKPTKDSEIKLTLTSFDNIKIRIGKIERKVVAFLRQYPPAAFDTKDSGVHEFVYNLPHESLGEFLTRIYAEKDLGVKLPPKAQLAPLLNYQILKREVDQQDANIETFADFSKIRPKIDPKLAHALHEHQKEALTRVLSANGRLLIGDDMGLGKTLVAIAAAQYYHSRIRTKVLILAPKSMLKTWFEEIVKWSPETFDADEIQTIVQTKQELDSNAKITIITYDMFTRIATGRMEFRRASENCLLILDESHAVKGAKSNKTKATKEYAENVAKFVILMSGTPALAKPVELFPQISMIRPDIFPGRISERKFLQRYCDQKLKELPGGKKFFTHNGCSNIEELKTYLDVFVMIRREKTNLIELPEKRRIVKRLTAKIGVNDVGLCEQLNVNCATAKSRRALREAILEFYQKSAEVKLPLVNAYLKRKLQEKSTGKIVIFGHHRCMIEGISSALEDAGTGYIQIDGRVSADARGEAVDRFQNNADVRVAVISILAGNSGITLTASNLVIFAELNWTPGYIAQAEDRVHRIGQTKPVTIEYLICNDLVDSHIWRMLKSKHDQLQQMGLGKANQMHVNQVDDVLNSSNLPDPEELEPEAFDLDDDMDEFDDIVNMDLDSSQFADVEEVDTVVEMPDLGEEKSSSENEQNGTSAQIDDGEGFSDIEIPTQETASEVGENKENDTIEDFTTKMDRVSTTDRSLMTELSMGSQKTQDSPT